MVYCQIILGKCNRCDYDMVNADINLYYMWQVFFCRRHNIAYAYPPMIFIILSLWYQTSVSVKITYWHRDFYDLLSSPSEDNLHRIYTMILYYFYIVLSQIFAIVITNFICQIWSLKWREILNQHYIDLWSQREVKIEGAAQRIQEDLRLFTDIISNIGIDFLKAIILIISLVPVLWSISNQVILPYINIPGSLVIIILSVYVIILSITWFITKKLPGLQYNNQVIEAGLRKKLVLSEEDASHKDPITISYIFKDIVSNYRKLFLHYLYFDLWYQSQNQLMIMLPYFLLSSSLCKGLITLGILSQTREVFRKVYQQFAVVLSDWKQIVELRSVHMRIKEFEQVVHGASQSYRPSKLIRI